MTIENTTLTPSPVATQSLAGVAPQPVAETGTDRTASTDPVSQEPNQNGLSVEKLQQAVDKMNALMQNGQRSLNFSVDDSSEQVVVKVVDIETEEVIRQIPSEETLKFAEYIEGMVGLIFDKKA